MKNNDAEVLSSQKSKIRRGSAAQSVQDQGCLRGLGGQSESSHTLHPGPPASVSPHQQR